MEILLKFIFAFIGGSLVSYLILKKRGLWFTNDKKIKK